MSGDIESRFTAYGHECVVVRNNGWRGGYVLLPLDSPFYGLKYGDAPLEFIDACVHGGLTFSGKWEKEDDGRDLWAFGFDCLHAGDAMDTTLPGIDETLFKTHSVGHVWTQQDVEQELMRLAFEFVKAEADIKFRHPEAENVCESCSRYVDHACQIDKATPVKVKVPGESYQQVCLYFRA